MKLSATLVMLIFGTSLLFSQSAKPDSIYYDFWEGTWYPIENGKIDTTSYFKVKKGINSLVFEEDWRMGHDGSLAKGIRAWDIINQKWQYIWMHESGLFQIWDGRKVDGNWYIYKHFNINGDIYLSRQTWIPTGNDELVRISEKSYDEGKTWQLRFKYNYKKVNDFQTKD